MGPAMDNELDTYRIETCTGVVSRRRGRDGCVYLYVDSWGDMQKMAHIMRSVLIEVLVLLYIHPSALP